MNIIIKNIIIVTVILSSIVYFYSANTNNYNTIRENRLKKVDHPELLPKKDIAKYSSFGFANLRADLYWLDAIQYIGGNAVTQKYKLYLYSMIDIITDLNPYFELPYTIGQLLLPDEGDELHSLQARNIGEKGISNFCDIKKVEAIINEEDMSKLLTEDIYINPCLTYKIAFNQGFLEYFYLNNPKSSSEYYKISAANENSLPGAKIMAGIMSGKGGDRMKSSLLFLTLATENSTPGDACNIISSEITNMLLSGMRVDTEFIENLENLRKEFLESQDLEGIESIKDCSNYTNKAIRELNLAYIEAGNKNYLKITGQNAKNADTLYKEGYIDFLPTDFQQYDDYGIKYIFNPSTGNFDYKMSN